jgi:hypothetical protein
MVTPLPSIPCWVVFVVYTLIVIRTLAHTFHVTIMALNNYELYQKGNTQIDPLKSDAVLKENFIKAIGESKKHILH